MKEVYKTKSVMMLMLMLLYAGVSAASAADRFYVEAINIEPGEQVELPFNLENEQSFYGFQADITLPEGLEIISDNGKANMTLSSRFNSSYTTVSNLIDSRMVRLGAFSLSHSAISGNEGTLFSIPVKASDTFTGGTLTISDILFVGEGDSEVELPDYSVTVGTVHNDRCYIEDFTIAVGASKTVSLILDNETQFTAFQTDIYLPEGLEIADDSFVTTERATAGHTVVAKSYPDGKVRVICHTLDNERFIGSAGPLVAFEIRATKDVAESVEIKLENQIFSTAKAKEYVLPDSYTHVTTERIFVGEILLDPTAIEIGIGDIYGISAIVVPSDASTKELKWTSSDEKIAVVSDNGFVTGMKNGSAVITAAATDGSGVSSTCSVTVVGIETGISPVGGVASSKIELRMADGRLTISGLTEGVPVSVYSFDGYLINTGKATVGEYVVPEGLSGVYLVRAGAEVYKVRIP